MTTHVNTPEKAHKLSELIEYYEVCNRAEGKSPKTISWYSTNSKSFRNYLKNRHLPDLQLRRCIPITTDTRSYHLGDGA